MSKQIVKSPWDLAYELVSTWDGNKYSKADIDDMLFCEIDELLNQEQA